MIGGQSACSSGGRGHHDRPGMSGKVRGAVCHHTRPGRRRNVYDHVWYTALCIIPMVLHSYNALCCYRKHCNSHTCLMLEGVNNINDTFT